MLLLTVIALILYEGSVNDLFYIEYVYDLAVGYDHEIPLFVALPVALVSLSHFVRRHWLRGVACLLGALSVGFISIFKLLGWYGDIGMDWIWDIRWPLYIPLGAFFVWSVIDAITDEGV